MKLSVNAIYRPTGEGLNFNYSMENLRSDRLYRLTTLDKTLSGMHHYEILHLDGKKTGSYNTFYSHHFEEWTANRVSIYE